MSENLNQNQNGSLKEKCKGGDIHAVNTKEIVKLRKGFPIIIDYHNSNRYRFVAQENNESKTAYYFSTPIYSRKSRKLLDLRYRSNGERGRLLSY